MIKSMTGFASLTRDEASATISVTVRAVNHRFLDVQLRSPSSLAAIESRLRALVQQHVARGRVEVAISVQSRLGQPMVDIAVNEAVIEGLSSALERARERGLVVGGLTAGRSSAVPAGDQHHRAEGRLARRDRAAGGRSGAGRGARRSRSDAHGRRGAPARGTRWTPRAARGSVRRGRRGGAGRRRGPAGPAAERVKEMQADTTVDEAAVAQEIVRYANRSDITEETVRFRAHLEHWRALSDSPEPCGRKLDFLLQEMNREVNTLGSKAEGAGVSEIVVSLKAELEKMREQVQNVE